MTNWLAWMRVFAPFFCAGVVAMVVIGLIAAREELLRSLRNRFDLHDGLLLAGVALSYFGLRQWSHALANTALGVSLVLFAILTERS